ncbi:MAG: CDP-glycerol glycerophosphotransferase family protein [Candidatus Hodarchaeales archaeon]
MYVLVFEVLFKILDFIWPKDNRKLVFGGGRGVCYNDNTKFLFEKFLENYSNEFDLIWVTRNKKLAEELNQSVVGGRFVYQFSIEGIRTLLSAKVVFSTYDWIDFPGIGFSRRTMTIQVWHGIPIKTGMKEDKRVHANNLHNLIKSINNWMVKYRYTHWISSSTIERNLIALITGLPTERVIITGYPRNDYLIEQMTSPSSNLHHEYEFLKKKVILYAPTWRHRAKTVFFPFDDTDLEKLHSLLEANDAYLLLRGHLIDEPGNTYLDDFLRQKESPDYDSYKTNRILTTNRDKFEELQELLPYVDILISDYSSVWVDFLLTERPMIFIPYDLDSYMKEPGLLFDYETITPGPKVNSHSELLIELEHYLKDPTRDKARRETLKRLFHRYEDGLSYRRIFEFIMIKLQRDMSDLNNP